MTASLTSLGEMTWKVSIHPLASLGQGIRRPGLALLRRDREYYDFLNDDILLLRGTQALDFGHEAG